MPVQQIGKVLDEHSWSGLIELATLSHEEETWAEVKEKEGKLIYLLKCIFTYTTHMHRHSC